MYDLVLTLHNALRLVALLLVVAVLWRGLRGWIGDRPFDRGDRTWSLVMLIVVDLQLVLGLALYLVWSPAVKSAMNDMGAAMKDPELRRWAVEHPTMMLGAIVLLHLGNVLRKRVHTDVQRHRWMALSTAIALALLIVGTTWPWNDAVRPVLRIGG